MRVTYVVTLILPDGTEITREAAASSQEVAEKKARAEAFAELREWGITIDYSKTDVVPLPDELLGPGT